MKSIKKKLVQVARDKKELSAKLVTKKARYNKMLEHWRRVKKSSEDRFLPLIITCLANIDAAVETNNTLKNMGMDGILDVQEIINYNNNVLRVALFKEILINLPLKKSTKRNLFYKHINRIFEDNGDRKNLHDLFKLVKMSGSEKGLLPHMQGFSRPESSKNLAIGPKKISPQTRQTLDAARFGLRSKRTS